MKVLVAEDDDTLRGDLECLLRARGDIVRLSGNGNDALFLGETEDWDAIVLDLGLPGLDGLSILREWRSRNVAVPVLILSARDSWNDIVSGLRSGADDYLSKPFHSEELLARLEALVRRASGRGTPSIDVGDLSVLPDEKAAFFKGRSVSLTAFEFRALEHLARHAGSVVSRADLIEHIYAEDMDLQSNVIDVLVSRLRRKTSAGMVETVRGHGYRIPVDDA
ncbi:response regulator transcription factor [Ruegeria marisrubri]|jgi:two-component system OmpR family response regulator|uniref:response regulator transcription factor n=1 Tax=Ruegeria TaxID=97050 RepID=UPI00147D7B31|nr:MULTISPECIES: response regulator transcription factor [Ruegeria]MCA0908505.1 response regulator transcription factor [Ruegeria marisrubri]NOE28380.1 response regulator [Ruegeria sp. HKCCD6157]